MSTQPALPLDVEAQIAVRNLRFITAGLGDADAAALRDLADGLERSLNHTGVVQR